MSPALASQNAYLAFYINYAEAYNHKAVFARDSKTKQFVLEKDVADSTSVAGSAANTGTTSSIGSEYASGVVGPESLQGPDVKASGAADTAFHQLMHSPPRLTLPGDEAARNELLAKTPKLQAALVGKEFVPVSAEDIGVEAIDDYTVRISLSQPAPYFLGLLGHQLFRLAPRNIVEKYGEQWTQPGTHCDLWPIQDERVDTLTANWSWNAIRFTGTQQTYILMKFISSCLRIIQPASTSTKWARLMPF